MSIKHTYIIKEGTETRVITKAKAIRMHCMDCSGWQSGEVVKCTAYTCALYPFRFGNEKGLERKYIPSKDETPEEEEIDDEEEMDDEEWAALMEEEEDE